MAEAKVDKYVGIDVSKNTLDLLVRPTGTRLQRPNDADGIAYLVKQLRRMRPKKVALVASMHKLLTILNAMARDARRWQPASIAS